MKIIGKVNGINTSDGMLNIQVNNKDGITYNLKVSNSDGNDIKICGLYEFEVEVKEDVRTTYNILSYINVDEFDFKKKDTALREFFEKSPISLEESEKEINNYINIIDNKILKDITINLIKKHHDDYFLYPAAARMHHAYVGGLAHHSIGMLHLADGFLNAYPYLNKDYLYSGIILHDIGKTKELTQIIAPEYSKEGQLLGHLVMGAMEISQMAQELGYKDTDEALVLEHMLISHHGQPLFGSAKKPMVAEAIALWLIDTTDSKLRVLGSELDKIEDGEFTQQIGVLDKIKVYKIND